MRSLKSLILSIIVAAIALPSVAQSPHGLTGSFVIERVAAREMGFEISTTLSVQNPSNCIISKSFRIAKDAENYDAITAALLTAFATGKPVTLYATGCENDGVTRFIAAFVSH